MSDIEQRMNTHWILCPVCYSKIRDRIRAVILRLSAVSVKGFLAWLLLSALLLQLSSLLRMLSFGRCAMRSGEILIAQSTTLYEWCISLSNNVGLLPTERSLTLTTFIGL